MAEVRSLTFKAKYAIESTSLQKANNLFTRFRNRVMMALQAMSRFGRIGSQAFTILSNAASAYGAVLLKLGQLGKRVFSIMGNAVRGFRNLVVNTRFEVAALGAALTAIYSKFTIDGVRAATSAEETWNRFRVSFGETFEEAIMWVNEYSRAVGRGRTTIADYLSQAQDFLTGLGATRQQALALSKQMVTLGLDLASFNDVAEDVALSNLMSGLLGNHRAVRGLRIILNQTNLTMRAASEGYKENFRDLDELTKVQLRLIEAYQQSPNAINDLIRTSDSAANRFKKFGGSVKSTQEILFKSFKDGLGESANSIANFLFENERGVQAAGSVLGMLGDIISQITNHILAATSVWSSLNKQTKEFALVAAGIVAFGTPILGILVIFGRALTLIGLFTAALIALVLVAQDLWVGFKGGESAFYPLVDRFLIASGVLEKLQSAFKLTKQVIFNELVPALVKLWELFDMSDTLGLLAQIVSSTFKIIVDVVRWALAFINGDTKLMQELALSLVGNLKNLFVETTKFIALTIRGVVRLLWDLFKTVLRMLKELFMQSLHAFTDIFVQLFDAVKARFLDPLTAGIKGAISNLGTFISKFRAGVSDFFSGPGDVNIKTQTTNQTVPGSPIVPGSEPLPLVTPASPAPTTGGSAISVSGNSFSFPVVLPEGFTGDPEELKQQMAAVAEEAFSEAMTNTMVSVTGGL